MESWQEAQLQSVLRSENESELFTVLSRAAVELGFEYCAYGMRMPLPVAKPRLFVVNNYPTAWQQRYAQNNYIAVDPTVAHGMRSVTPLVWSKVLSQEPAFWDDAHAHGLRVGWAQSCFDGRGVGGMLSLARSAEELSIEELRSHSMKMSWLAQAAHEGMSRLLVPKLMPESEACLSKREIEVLRWTADGKTAGEVGRIMHIAEATVNFHVNKALSKLGVTNKAAAAIKVAFLGLL
jgi:LuxR family transcriptional regulator